MGRLIVLVFVSTLIIGGILTFEIPLRWVGHLPGDFTAYWKGYTVVIPIGTAVIVSVLLSALLYLLPRK